MQSIRYKKRKHVKKLTRCADQGYQIQVYKKKEINIRSAFHCTVSMGLKDASYIPDFLAERIAQILIKTANNYLCFFSQTNQVIWLC